MLNALNKFNADLKWILVWYLVTWVTTSASIVWITFYLLCVGIEAILYRLFYQVKCSSVLVKTIMQPLLLRILFHWLLNKSPSLIGFVIKIALAICLAPHSSDRQIKFKSDMLQMNQRIENTERLCHMSLITTYKCTTEQSVLRRLKLLHGVHVPRWNVILRVMRSHSKCSRRKGAEVLFFSFCCTQCQLGRGLECPGERKRETNIYGTRDKGI